MEPTKLDLHLYAGDDWSRTLTFYENDAPKDLTGFTWLAQIRRRHFTDVERTMEVDPIDPTNGVIVLSLTAAQTEDMRDRYVWDLQWTDTSDQIRTVLAGALIVSPEVSK